MLQFALFVVQISAFSLDNYNTYGEIDEWVEQKGGRIIALSQNGRNIRAVEIFANEESPAKTIMVDCGKGARDWISITFCLNLINELSTGNRELGNVNWVILPLLNPDGYAYTWSQGFEKIISKKNHNVFPRVSPLFFF